MRQAPRQRRDENLLRPGHRVRGTLLLTSNIVMVRDGMLQEWFERHHNEWPGVQARHHW